MQGTLINAAAVIIGSLLGLMIHSRLPQRIITIVFQGIGLFTIYLGINMASQTHEFLLLVLSIVIGSIIGEAIDIDQHLNRLSEYLKTRIRTNHAKFSEGFITAFMLFCVGSMTFLGAIEEGLGGKPNLLLAKSVLDGFSSVALAAGLGIGVLLSVIPLLVFQGGLTLSAGLIERALSESMMTTMTAVGGLLLIGLGINLLEIKKLKVTNMLPSLIIALILAYLL